MKEEDGENGSTKRSERFLSSDIEEEDEGDEVVDDGMRGDEPPIFTK